MTEFNKIDRATDRICKAVALNPGALRAVDTDKINLKELRESIRKQEAQEKK